MKVSCINKRMICAAIMILFGMVIMTGCEETKELEVDNEETTSLNTEEDTIVNLADQYIFCGIYVTFEDVFENANYKNNADSDSAKKLISEIREMGYSSKVIVADKKMVEKNGQNHTQYEFSGCDGVPIFVYYENINQNMSCNEDFVDEEIDVDYDHNSNTAKKVETEYIYANMVIDSDKNSEDLFLHYNGVYQSRNGDVFMVPNDVTDVHGAYSLHFNEESKVNIGGETYRFVTNVALNVKEEMLADRMELMEFDDEDNFIRTQEIKNGGIPESVAVMKDTDYLVLQSYKGEKLMKREIVNLRLADEDVESAFSIMQSTGYDLLIREKEIDVEREE